MSEPTTREALRAIAWAVTKDYVRREAKKNRTGRRRKRHEHLAINGTLVSYPREAPETTFVYVIGGAGYPVKVGYSKDAAARLSQLQTGCPAKLRIYSHFSVPARLVVSVERRAHDILAAKRLNGEWFDVTGHEAEDAVLLAIHEIVVSED